LKIFSIQYILNNSDILFVAILAILETALPAIVELNSWLVSWRDVGLFDESWLDCFVIIDWVLRWVSGENGDWAKFSSLWEDFESKNGLKNNWKKKIFSNKIK